MNLLLLRYVYYVYYQVYTHPWVHVHVAAPTCPANCKLYFDGCNNCRCFPGGAMGCTRMACDPAKRMRPYCKEESAPAIVGTDIV